MTENEAIKNVTAYVYMECENMPPQVIKALNIMKDATKEIQAYRAYKEVFENHFTKEAIELLSDKEEFSKWLERGKWITKRCDEINRELESYRAIGTVEEFKALKEKNESKKPICKSMQYSEEVGMNEEWYCPNCNSYVGYFTEGMNEPEQMEYCNVCGQHIARDWSE